MGDIKRYRLKKLFEHPWGTMGKVTKTLEEWHEMFPWAKNYPFLEDWMEEVKEEKPKEWEILQYNHWKTGGLSNMPSMHRNDPVTIHSVKRLSDGEVFTIGDDTNVGKIKSFFQYTENESQMCAKCESQSYPNGEWGLDVLHKIQKSKQKEEVFTWDAKTRQEIEKWLDSFDEAKRYISQALGIVKDKQGNDVLQSKQSSNTESKEERVSVYVAGSGGLAGQSITVRPMKSSHAIPNEKLPLIREAIESVLNIKKKKLEILRRAEKGEKM